MSKKLYRTLNDDKSPSLGNKAPDNVEQLLQYHSISQYAAEHIL